MQEDTEGHAYTCVTPISTESGAELLALGSTSGKLIFVNKQYESDTVLTDSNPISNMAFDEVSKTIALGNTNGSLNFVKVDSASSATQLTPVSSDLEIPVTSMGTLNRGETILVVGYANGVVKLFNFSGEQLCEIGSHS